MSYTDRPRFYYPTTKSKQLALPGVDVSAGRSICGEGHIAVKSLGHDVLLCGKTVDGLKKKHGGGVFHSTRVEHVSICAKCEKKFKEMPGGSYQKFVSMQEKSFVLPADHKLEVPTSALEEQ